MSETSKYDSEEEKNSKLGIISAVSKSFSPSKRPEYKSDLYHLIDRILELVSKSLLYVALIMVLPPVVRQIFLLIVGAGI